MRQKDTELIFEDIYREYRLYVIRTCRLYLGDPSLSEDAAQDTFFKIYRGLHSFRGHSDVRTWITRIAVNTCKDILRRRQPLPLDDTAVDPKPLSERDDSLSLSAAISRLSPKLRETVILYYYQELTQKEIASMLRISSAAAAKRLERARAELREMLGEDFYEQN